jgi:hypothetical protein
MCAHHPSNPKMRKAGGGSASANSNAGLGISCASATAAVLLLPLAGIAPATLLASNAASRRASHCCSCLLLAVLPCTACSAGLLLSRAAAAAGLAAGHGVSGPPTCTSVGVESADSLQDSLQESSRYLAGGTACPARVVEPRCWCSSAASAAFAVGESPVCSCGCW